MQINTGPALTSPRLLPPLLVPRLLFSGGASQFGWLFFGFGLIFAWVFGAHSEAVTAWHFRGHLRTAPGVVTTVEKTGSSENDQHIYAAHYTFTPSDAGHPLTGTSYLLGSEPSLGAVTVEYAPAHPEWSRVMGMRSAEFGWPVIFVLLFPGIGLGIILWQLVKGARALRLLREGALTTATLTAVSGTNVSINSNPLFRLTFQYTTLNGMTCDTEYYTCNLLPAWMTLIGQLPGQPPLDAAEFREPLLYLPANPRLITLPRDLPSGITLDAGSVQDTGALAGLTALILPILVLGGHLGYLLRGLLHK